MACGIKVLSHTLINQFTVSPDLQEICLLFYAWVWEQSHRCNLADRRQVRHSASSPMIPWKCYLLSPPATKQRKEEGLEAPINSSSLTTVFFPKKLLWGEEVRKGKGTSCAAQQRAQVKG